MTSREMHHDVTVSQAPTPDNEGNGMQSIISAFMKNPVAAVEIIGMIGGGYGLYYALNQGITDAKATSEQHYKEISAESNRTAERLASKLDILAAADKSEVDDIKALYTRGDVRWSNMADKLSSIEVRFTKVEDSLQYIIVQQQQRSATVPHDQRGEMPFLPRSRIAGEEPH